MTKEELKALDDAEELVYTFVYYDSKLGKRVKEENHIKDGKVTRIRIND